MFGIINKSSLNEYGIYSKNVILIRDALNQFENKKLLYILVNLFDFEDLIKINNDKRDQIKKFIKIINQTDLSGIIDTKNEKLNKDRNI